MEDTHDTQLVRAVGRIEGMLTSLTTQLTQSHADNTARFSQMEKRLRDVESKVSRAFGIGAALILMLNVLSYWVHSLFPSH